VPGGGVFLLFTGFGNGNSKLSGAGRVLILSTWRVWASH